MLGRNHALRHGFLERWQLRGDVRLVMYTGGVGEQRKQIDVLVRDENAVEAVEECVGVVVRNEWRKPFAHRLAG